MAFVSVNENLAWLANSNLKLKTRLMIQIIRGENYNLITVLSFAFSKIKYNIHLCYIYFGSPLQREKKKKTHLSQLLSN